ncbi:MAG TPA: PIN domain-containing protein [Sedimentisphaerales bacterium]|nr:PIN domain-containing protein [Sedimentisphaerales bacterium]
MQYVILDSNIILSFPEILSRRLADLQLVVPFDVQLELMQAGSFGPASRTGSLSGLYRDAVKEGIIRTEPTIAKGELMRTHRMSAGDADVLATALDLKKEGKDILIATEDRPLRRLAEKNNLTVWGLEEVRAKALAGTTVPRLDVQARIVSRAQTRGLVLGLCLGVLVSGLVILVWHFFRDIVRTVPVWGTLIGIAFAGAGLFWCRGRWRFAYGVTETIVGLVIAVKVLWPSFDYATLDASSFLQILGGIYVMVRGQDNIGKSLQGTRFHAAWVKYSHEVSK